MEEAVVSVVSLAIERISYLLIREAAYLQGGVREEVERLKAKLDRLNSILKVADYQTGQTELHRTLVRQIRDLAYEAEDVIDSSILDAAGHREGSQVIIKRLASFLKPSHRFKKGSQFKEILTRLDDIFKYLPSYDQICRGESSSSATKMLQQRQRLRRSNSHVKEADVVSLEGVTREVLAQLREEDDKYHVVSIVGMGGIGKTILAKKVYNDVKRQFDCCAWAVISQDCKPREVVHDVLIKVLSPSKEDREEIDKLKEDELIKRLFNALTEKRYLVVLDDIWKIEDWKSLNPAFPQGQKGSRILFTTRNKDVALFAHPCNSPIEHPFLTDDESWELLKRKAFPGNKLTEYEAQSKEFETIGREMVTKCGGLPLAIVVLGALLATKMSPAQWKMIQRSIHAHLNKVPQPDNMYGAVNEILVLSYNDLPYQLKPCFLYLGHFPEDWEISKEELIRLWIAEGFISPLVHEGMLMEDVAEEFLEDLINRCLVQVGQRDCRGIVVETCRIHDLLRDLCMVKAREEKFLEIIQPSTRNDRGSLDVTFSESMLRRIAIHPNKRYVCLKGKHPKLRSLLLFQDEKLIELHISECKNFKFLRVLKVVKKDVELWYVSSAIGNLRHLRYLRLQCSRTGQIILPRSIGNLKNLHTLHVESSKNMIPCVVCKLEHLRHILFFGHGVFRSGLRFCQKMCSPMFTSNHIETLKCIVVESLDENNEVLNLTNVQDLGIIFKRSKDVLVIIKALMESQRRLRSLYMKLSTDSDTFPDLEPLSQCHHLSQLKLEGKILDEGPQSSHHVLKLVPTSIVELTLTESKLMQDPMSVLEKMPHLKFLSLRWHAYKGTKLICSANGFPQLDYLGISYLLELEEWEIEEGAMPRLRNLMLVNIISLRMFLEGLRNLTTLRQMKLFGMKRSLIERIQVIDGREGEDFSKVSHILPSNIQIQNTQG